MKSWVIGESETGEMGSLVFQIQQAARLFERMLDPALEELGLLSSEVPVLIVASRPDGVAMGQLRDSFGYPSATLSTIVNRLERTGYIRRIRDGPDQRLVSVVATLPGQTAAIVAGARVAEIEKRIGIRAGQDAVGATFVVLDAARRIRPPRIWD